jgi:hypothetical protein
VQDRVPETCDFKVDSIFMQLGASGLVATVAYSNDDGTTWTCVPMSGAGGAPPESFAPMNQVTVGFDVRIR